MVWRWRKHLHTTPICLAAKAQPLLGNFESTQSILRRTAQRASGCVAAGKCPALTGGERKHNAYRKSCAQSMASHSCEEQEPSSHRARNEAIGEICTRFIPTPMHQAAAAPTSKGDYRHGSGVGYCLEVQKVVPRRSKYSIIRYLAFG